MATEYLAATLLVKALPSRRDSQKGSPVPGPKFRLNWSQGLAIAAPAGFLQWKSKLRNEVSK